MRRLRHYLSPYRVFPFCFQLFVLWLTCTRLYQQRLRASPTTNATILRTPRYPSGGSFQQVGKESVWVYSAYRDDRQERGVVRLLALAARKATRPLYCYYHSSASSRNECRGPARRQHINPSLSKRFTYFAYFYTCDLPVHWKGEAGGSLQVALSAVHCANRVLVGTGIHWLPVADTWTEGPPVYNYSVCVSPVFGPESRKWKPLLRTIETNLFFGADQVLVYNHSLPADMKPFLAMYIGEGKVGVIDWPLLAVPEMKDKSLHYKGQNLAINDCVYRLMAYSSYVIVTDLDEVIVPRTHSSWPSMTRDLRGSPNDSFLFRHVGFDYDHTFELELFYFDVWNRQGYPWPPGIRSKLMVRPACVEAIGVHVIFRLLPGCRQVEVTPSVGLLHHYNKRVLGTLGRRRMNDTRLAGLRNIFRQQLKARYEKLKRAGIRLPGLGLHRS